MDEDFLKLLAEFHKKNERQGPGGDAETRKALSFVTGTDQFPDILDIGCGTGAQTLVLASQTNGSITAVDLLPEFIEELEKEISSRNIENRISTKVASMEELPFQKETFDIIWSEGAIYHIGFERGLKEWKPLLKSGGYLVVSEISWLTEERPAEIADFWEKQYPEIAPLSTKIRHIEQSRYQPEAHFVLPEYCWTDNYYQPIADRSEAFLENHNYSKKSQKLIAEGESERKIYEKYKTYYSYVFYIAKKK